ncbi:MAG: hypothetical protein Tsb0018_05940 [Opitutales bacterium]|tara:strand:+ start:6127 stop:6600 length:474 start_codon:yes stop_codon:yes gene_type:complete
MFNFLKKLFQSNNPDANTQENSPDLPDKDKKPVWIGVDLDGTLAYFDGWQGIHHIGRPVPTMLKRVKHWLKKGHTVKIVTARASIPEGVEPVRKWLTKHGLEDLEVTNAKDFYMLELWDDRAVQVIPNMGKPVISPSVLSLPRAPLLEVHAPHEIKD